MVLTAISTSAVKVRPMREWTATMSLIDLPTYMKKVMYARYRNREMAEKCEWRVGDVSYCTKRMRKK
jgi:hypothetical protein